MVLDDSTLDKPYACNSGPLTRPWSGKHWRVGQGINLLTRLWTDGEALLPCDDHRYEKAVDRLSTNDHCRTMLATPRE